MNIVQLNVNRQRIFIDGNSAYLASGSYNYAKLQILFLTDDWEACDVVEGIFKDNDGNEYLEIMDINNLIDIPQQLKSGEFSFSLKGFNNNQEQILSTGIISLVYNKSLSTNEEFEPSIYEKIVRSIYNAIIDSNGIKFVRNNDDEIVFTPQQVASALPYDNTLVESSSNLVKSGDIKGYVDGLANTLQVSMDPTTYILTFSLYNKSGGLNSQVNIDLPLEELGFDIDYDENTKELVFTFKDGHVKRVPIGDLVSGLQREITPQNKLSSDLVDDTNHTNKFVTEQEKQTWGAKQDQLVSGTNIKTINNASILGSGNLEIKTGNEPDDVTIELDGNDKLKIKQAILNDIDNRVEKESGKGLSTNDFTNEYKSQVDANTQKVSNVQADWNATEGQAVILNKPTNLGIIDDVKVNNQSVVQNRIAEITLDKNAVGLGNVDNTSDLNKPISTATQSALNTIDGKLNVDVHVKSSGNTFSYNGDTVTYLDNYKNLDTGSTSTHSEYVQLANGTTAGMMSPSDYNAIRDNASRIEALEGQTKRLLYVASMNPTAQEIASFVTQQGYTEHLESVAVVVNGTYHIWHYYTNDGWRDDGVDTVNTFTNQSAGIIKGSSNDGQVFAENDGTGSVYGWSDLKNRVSNIETKDTGYDAHVSDTTIHVTSADKQTWNGKQDTISDLSTIRSNASAGASKISANDSTIQIQANGQIKGSFTTNQASGSTIDLGTIGGALLYEIILTQPANLSASGTTIEFDPVDDATSYEVFADGVSIGEKEVN